MKAPGRGELALAAGSVALVALALLAAEWVLRRAQPEEREQTARSDALAQLHVPSERYGWELRRGFRATLSGRRVTIGSQGHRGPDVEPQPAPGVERIVVLGDSVAFGLEVDDAQTFAARLGDAGAREVINLAVQGYGTDQELLRLEREGPAFSPDAVVLALCVANDFVDVGLDHFLYDGRHPKPYFTLERNELVLHAEHLRLGAAERLALWLSQRSLLARSALQLGTAGAPRDDRHWMRTVAEMEPRWARNVAIAARLILRMAERSREAGARFVVAAFPYRRSWDEGGSIELTALARLLGAGGVPLVEMRSEFQQRGLAFEDFAWDKLGHLSSRGHAEAAEVLDRVLGELAADVSRAPGGGPPAR